MTKKEAHENVRKNTWLDRLFAGVAAAIIMALATKEITRHLTVADYRMGIALAVLGVGFLAYIVVAPIFRK